MAARGIMFYLSIHLAVTELVKTNEPILMPIGTSGLQAAGMKRSTLEVRR